MSKSYAECCAEVGYNPKNANPPEQVKQWFAYVDGKAIQCADQAEAKKYKLNECVLDPASKQEIVKYWDDQRKLEVKAADLFMQSLRAEYPAMSTPLFDLCYHEAYSRGHSSGLDEVAAIMDDVVDFALSAIKLKK